MKSSSNLIAEGLFSVYLLKLLLEGCSDMKQVRRLPICISTCNHSEDLGRLSFSIHIYTVYIYTYLFILYIYTGSPATIFDRSVYEPPIIFIVKVYNDPKGTTILNIVVDFQGIYYAISHMLFSTSTSDT